MLSSRCLRIALIAPSFLLICFTAFSHFSSVEHSTRLFLRSELTHGQSRLRPPTSYQTILSHIRPSDSLSQDELPHSRTLGIASKIYVISLLRRVDRRRSMDALSRALDLEFEYVDGVETTDVRVGLTMSVLKWERQVFRERFLQEGGIDNFHGFDFPSIDEAATLGDAEPDALFNITADMLRPLSSSTSSSQPSVAIPNHDNTPLACATPRDPFPAPLDAAELSLLPPWRILSGGMVACWMAHLEIIRRVAAQSADAVALVLEDDVDMEFDIERRMVGIWPALPVGGWDIVMLGHCHSNETAYPPLPLAASVRPSFAPKCTHAYALSRTGARRLSRILSAPGFACSRALDQAISWLVNTNKLRSYSVVPPIIIQSKRSASDIWRPRAPAGVENPGDGGNDKGSKWRDYLVDSTLERIEMVRATGFDVANA